MLINTHLLAAQKQGVRSHFYGSSACVYRGDLQDAPENPGLREEDAYPASPEDGYGWEKLFSERMCRHFAGDFGLRTRVARYHNVYVLDATGRPRPQQPHYDHSRAPRVGALDGNGLRLGTTYRWVFGQVASLKAR